MSEMVERVARAIFKEWDVDRRSWSALDETETPFWYGIARAAVEAMRKPTEAMIDACHAATVFEDGGLSASELLNQPRIAWNAMIAAALKSA